MAAGACCRRVGDSADSCNIAEQCPGIPERIQGGAQNDVQPCLVMTAACLPVLLQSLAARPTLPHHTRAPNSHCPPPPMRKRASTAASPASAR